MKRIIMLVKRICSDKIYCILLLFLIVSCTKKAVIISNDQQCSANQYVGSLSVLEENGECLISSCQDGFSRWQIESDIGKYECRQNIYNTCPSSPDMNAVIYQNIIDMQTGFYNCHIISCIDHYNIIDNKCILTADNSNMPTLAGSNYLVAVKTYTPLQYEDGSLNLDGSYNATIPSELSVFEGNAGSWTAEVRFDSSLVCVYKGASTMTNPLYTGNTTAIDAGKSYKFQYCKDATTQVVSAHNALSQVHVQDKVLVTIKNGDSQATTKVQVNIILIK